MPPKFLFDLSSIELDRVLFDQDAIRQANPQRGDMEHLNAIVHCDGDTHRIVGYKDIRPDEFWVSGHIPGRPLFPGVLMIEAAAQLASFYTKQVLKWSGFVGFGGVNNVKFRMQVLPGTRLYLIGERKWERHRRIGCDVQGMINGELAFEAEIVGAQF
ncbi:MAG: beta-hydroxyacyl-ACP dehydratase [Phycisphaerales bacterium]|nr:beta-hydroxyacyl-ACP dehydratase [Phycisphaerales bacterium]